MQLRDKHEETHTKARDQNGNFIFDYFASCGCGLHSIIVRGSDVAHGSTKRRKGESDRSLGPERGLRWG